MKRKRRQAIASEPLQPVTPDELRARLGRGGQVNWINRLATQPADLQRHRRIVITGRMKLGKTREAVELIARAARDLVPAGRVFEPGATFQQFTAASLPATLHPELTAQTPALLFLDDLPWHYSGDGLSLIAATLSALDRCRPAYVVATARDEHLSDEHRAWLVRHGFYEIELPDLGEMETGRLLDNAAGVYDLHVDDEARAALVAERDGTPERILATLRLVSDDPTGRVDAVSVRRHAEKSIADLWVEKRHDLERREAAAGPLFEALAAFHAAHIPAHLALIMGYAIYVWRGRTLWRPPFFPRGALRRALASLATAEIVVLGLEIYYPDSAVEDQATPEKAAQLRAFLKPRSLYSPLGWIAIMQPLGLVQWLGWLLLADGARILGLWKTSALFLTHALRINPNPAVLANRAYASARAGQAQMLADLTNAIALDGEHAGNYLNRGYAFVQQGDLARGMADLNRAIQLNPNFAKAYNNRGFIYAQQGNLYRAIEDFTSAIALDPKLALPYFNRALAHYRQGNLTQALADVKRARQLPMEPRQRQEYEAEWAALQASAPPADTP